jgi:hypothetical protein
VNKIYSSIHKSLLHELEELEKQGDLLGTTKYEDPLQVEILEIKLSMVGTVTYMVGFQTIMNWCDNQVPEFLEEISEGTICIRMVFSGKKGLILL